MNDLLVVADNIKAYLPADRKELVDELITLARAKPKRSLVDYEKMDDLLMSGVKPRKIMLTLGCKVRIIGKRKRQLGLTNPSKTPISQNSQRGKHESS